MMGVLKNSGDIFRTDTESFVKQKIPIRLSADTESFVKQKIPIRLSADTDSFVSEKIPICSNVDTDTIYDEIFFQNEFKYLDSHIDLANFDCVEELFFQICDYNSLKNYKPYNPILKAKGSGVIPYAFKNGQIYFLLQKQISPLKRKDSGWVDFGGKKDNNESTILTATREFSEETSCLFYLKELENIDTELYAKLKDNPELKYSDETVNELLNLIPKSEQYFYDKINAFVDPVYVSSKETYISYLLKVNYIPAEDLPRAEDIHIPYEDRYIRKCKWFSLGELMLLEEYNLHKRLQITKMKNRIKNYYDKGLLD